MHDDNESKEAMLGNNLIGNPDWDAHATEASRKRRIRVKSHDERIQYAARRQWTGHMTLAIGGITLLVSMIYALLSHNWTEPVVACIFVGVLLMALSSQPYREARETLQWDEEFEGVSNVPDLQTDPHSKEPYHSMV